MANQPTNWVKVLVWVVIIVIVIIVVGFLFNEFMITGGSEGGEKAGIILLNL